MSGFKNQMEEYIKEFLLENPGYLKKGDHVILDRLGFDQTDPINLKICKKVKKSVKENRKVKFNPIKKQRQLEVGDNILVIGDLHEPFCLDGYLDFCKEVYEEQECNTVIFIGDIIDNHYSSYHETDPDGYGAGEELDRAIDKIQKWYQAFPEAYVIIGNHDRLVYRKAHSSGLSKRWIREFHEVLETPGWEFLEEITINGVCYNHGEGMHAVSRMKNEMQSQVQGHYHSKFYLDYNVSPVQRVFAMQVGCGIDRRSYGMAYGKHHKKPIIGCATVKGNPPIPQLHPMEL